MAIYSDEKKKKQYQQPVEQQAATTQAAQSPIGGGLTAQQRYDQVLSQQPQQKTNLFTQQVQDTYNQIVNRGPFQYDVNGDALFQQYKDQVVGLGKTAMMDTMGQAAGLTGGYGSSYGQQAGQQAYNAYLQGLNEIVPDLQQQAYGRYQDEGTALQQQYAMLQDQQAGFTEEQERLYNQWLNALQIAEGDRNYAYQQEQDAKNWQWQQEQFAYQKQQDEADRLYQQQVLAYQQEQDRLNREDAANAEAYEKAFALWNAGYDSEEVRNTLGIPKDYQIPVGSAGGDSGNVMDQQFIQAGEDEYGNIRWYGVTDGKEYTFGPGVNPNGGLDDSNEEEIFGPFLDSNGGLDDSFEGMNIDEASVEALGLGDLTMDDLSELVANGLVEEYQENGVWKYRLTPKGSGKKFPVYDLTQKYLSYLP